jgi:hypothetical protein
MVPCINPQQDQFIAPLESFQQFLRANEKDFLESVGSTKNFEM